MQNVIVSTYKVLGDSDTITQGYRVVEKMENNPIFPNPPSALAETKKLLPELQSAVGDAKGRDLEAVALKNKLKAEVIALLTVLAEYVTVTCKGDRLNLLSSGFPISGASSTRIDQVISPLEVEIGPVGGASTSLLKRLRGARIYMHQYTTEPPASDTVWHSEMSKFSYHTFNGLTSMARYWFRIEAISAAGEKLTSQVVTRVIQ
jgi:hypothetical protein